MNYFKILFPYVDNKLLISGGIMIGLVIALMIILIFYVIPKTINQNDKK